MIFATMHKKGAFAPVTGLYRVKENLLHLLGLATEALMIAAIYHFLPVGRIALRYALVGGITATALWEIIRHVLVWYFNGLSNASVVYGSLTSAVDPGAAHSGVGSSL